MWRYLLWTLFTVARWHRIFKCPMPPSQGLNVPLRMAIAVTALLPFEVVAKISLGVAAVIFILQPFELARVYALATVAVVQVLARLHWAWRAGRWRPEGRLRYAVVYHEGNLTPCSSGELLLSPWSTADEVLDEMNAQRGVPPTQALNTTVADELGTLLERGSELTLADLRGEFGQEAGGDGACEVGSSAGVTLHAFLGHRPCLDVDPPPPGEAEATISIKLITGRTVALPYAPEMRVLACKRLLHPHAHRDAAGAGS